MVLIGAYVVCVLLKNSNTMSQPLAVPSIRNFRKVICLSSSSGFPPPSPLPKTADTTKTWSKLALPALCARVWTVRPLHPPPSPQRSIQLGVARKALHLLHWTSAATLATPSLSLENYVSLPRRSEPVACHRHHRPPPPRLLGKVASIHDK